MERRNINLTLNENGYFTCDVDGEKINPTRTLYNSNYIGDLVDDVLHFFLSTKTRSECAYDLNIIQPDQISDQSKRILRNLVALQKL